MSFVAVKGYYPAVADLKGQLVHDYRRQRVTLRCEGCPRRIAWWDNELRPGRANADALARGWKWQGERPIRFRRDLVDIECHSCGWQKAGAAQQPYPFWWLATPRIL